MRVGLITQWYVPETGAAAHPTAIAQALRAIGHEVEVLTGFPSYPGGRVHSGYRQGLRMTEQIDGVRLLRVPDIPSHDDSALRRAGSLTSFAASAAAQVHWLRKVDVCLVYLTPATVGAAAMLLKRLHRVPYVLYVQDLWPETVMASGFIRNSTLSRVVERGLSRYLSRLYAGASGMAAISPDMAATLAQRGARTPPMSIPNWVDEGVFQPASRPAHEPALTPGRTWFMYAGGIGQVQGLDHAVRAMKCLADRPDIGLAIVGDGVALPRLKELAASLEVSDRVAFLGPRPMQVMPSLMAAATAQLVSLRDLPLFRGTIPSKVQASMACASPVICAVAGAAADVVTSSSAGLAVPPEDSYALASAFRQMADMSDRERAAMGANGRAAYLQHLGADAGVARLNQLLETAVR